MRVLYATVAVLGGVACLAVVYVFGLLALAYNGGRGSMQVIFPYVPMALAVAALLTLIAEFMTPAGRCRAACSRRRPRYGSAPPCCSASSATSIPSAPSPWSPP